MKNINTCLQGLIPFVSLLIGCQATPPTGLPTSAPTKAPLLMLQCGTGISTPVQPQPLAVGARTVALLLFCDATVDISTLRTPAEYEAMLFTEGRLAFESWSLEKASLSGHVFGWYRVPDLAHRSKTELISLATGYNPTAYNITGYVLTSYSGGVAVIRSGQGDFTVGAGEGTGMILHELLHVCGLGHANKCADQSRFPVCRVQAYGDRYSVMGSNIYGDISGVPPTAMHREMLGWINVPVADSSAGQTKTFPLGLYESTGDAIKIPRGPKDWFYIERRVDGPHVTTMDPTDSHATLWLQTLPIIDKATGIEIRAVKDGVSVTWPDPQSLRDPDITFGQKGSPTS
jgi:hypothetical protein